MMAKMLYLSIFSLLRHYKYIFLEMRLPFVKKNILWSFFQHFICCHEINDFYDQATIVETLRTVN